MAGWVEGWKHRYWMRRCGQVDWWCVGVWMNTWVDGWRKQVSHCPSWLHPKEQSVPRPAPLPSTHRDDDICDGLVGHLGVPKRFDVEGADLQRGGHMQQESCDQQRQHQPRGCHPVQRCRRGSALLGWEMDLGQTTGMTRVFPLAVLVSLGGVCFPVNHQDAGIMHLCCTGPHPTCPS